MFFDRREFLVSASTLAAQLGLSGFMIEKSIIASAQALNPDDKDHFFVLYRTQGGLDVTLGLDPQIHHGGLDQNDVFLEYSPDEIIRSGEIKLGPSAAPLELFAKDISVVNGIFMSSADLGHDVGNNYISSGTPRTNPASFPFSLGLQKGTGPLGVVLGGARSVQGQTNGLLVSSAKSILDGQFASNNDSASKAASRIAGTQNSSSEFARSQKALVETQNIEPVLKRTLDKMRQQTQFITDAHAIAAAFVSGAAKQAEVSTDFNNNIDSHGSHEGNHKQAQLQVWTQVSDMFNVFKNLPYKKKTLFDHTTFLVISEFSRTPALNGNNGKDHNNLTNSVLLAGKGINSNKTFGKSVVISRRRTPGGMPIHMGAPFDIKTGGPGQTKENSMLLKPENLAASVQVIFNNYSPRSGGTAFPIPGLAKI